MRVPQYRTLQWRTRVTISVIRIYRTHKQNLKWEMEARKRKRVQLSNNYVSLGKVLVLKLIDDVIFNMIVQIRPSYYVSPPIIERSGSSLNIRFLIFIL